MIFYGIYKIEAGIFRPYISADILSPSNEWIEIDLLIDTGADETFLDFSFITILSLFYCKQIKMTASHVILNSKDYSCALFNASSPFIKPLNQFNLN